MSVQLGFCRDWSDTVFGRCVLLFSYGDLGDK